jgi:archaemetzincin
MWYAEAKKIYILPFGKLPGAVIERLTDTLTETFKKEILTADEQPLPVYAYDRYRQQCYSTEILKRINDLNLDGIVLAVIDADLYVPGLNFVFGEADPENGVCIISITRLRQEFYRETPEYELFLQRTVKEAVHEIGHLYGLFHCPDPECVMHFSNTLADTDRKTERFCKICIKGVTA